MILIDNPKTNNLIESFQANNMKFAFVNLNSNGQLHLIHTWVQCREYFNELLMKNYHPNEFSFAAVHGFVYDFDTFPMNLEQTMLACKFPSKESMDQFITNLPLLHSIEDTNDVSERTVITQVTSHEHTLLLVASKFWIQKALLLNIYTLLLKLMCFDMTKQTLMELHAEYLNKNKRLPTELGYVNQIAPISLNKILSNLDLIIQVPTKYVDGSEELRNIYAVHAWSGLLSVTKFKEQANKALPTLVEQISKITTSKKKFVRFV